MSMLLIEGYSFSEETDWVALWLFEREVWLGFVEDESK